MQFQGLPLTFLSILFLQVQSNLAETVCNGRVNLVVAMDSSSSLTSIQFLQIKNFTAKGLLKRFTQTNSIATVSFADNVEIVTDFGELNSDKIMMYNSNRDYHTRIDFAIGNMTDMMSSSSILDQSVPKVALILTDGKSTSGIELLHQSAMYADRNNVYVMAIGVGEEVNLSPTELDNMTHGINEHQQIIPYRDLTKSVDQVVEQICYLSQNGPLRTGAIRGRYLLTIVFDVTIQSLDLTKQLIAKLLEYIQYENPSVNLIIASVTDGPNSIGRFDEASSQLEVLKFIEHMTTSSHQYFDAVAAYDKVESDFLYAPSDSSNIALFITDKPIQTDDFTYTQNYFKTKSESNKVDVLFVGVGSAVSPDSSLALSGFRVAHRIIASNTSVLTSGLNNIIRAIGTEVLKYPVPVNVSHEAFHGPAEILIGYSNCPHMFNIEKFNRYNKFLENVVRNIHMGPDKVQLTLATYCTGINYVTSIKDYVISFHVPFGLQRGGVITQLQWTTENVIREVLDVYDEVESDVKIAIVIISDPFMEEDLTGLLKEADDENILIMPLALYHDNATKEGIEEKVNKMSTAIPPLFVSWTDLRSNGVVQTMNILGKYLTGNRNDILISASSMNLNDDLLKNNLKLYVRELQNVNNRETSSTLEQKMITDIQLYSRNMLNDNVRNTHAGLHGILMSFLFSEDPTENRIGFVISRGSSSSPSLTLSTARLLQDANIQMFALGYGVDGTRDRELSLIAGDETRITKLTSASDIIGAMNSVKNMMESVNLDTDKATHISVALDTSLNVTDTDVKNLKVMINMFIKLWSNGKNLYLTFGQFNRHYYPEFVRQAISDTTHTEMMQRVYSFERQSPRDSSHQVSRTPQALPLHITIRSLHQTMKAMGSPGSSQVVVIMFDKEPVDILLTDIAIREARLDNVHFVTIPIGIDSYPDTFTYTLPLYSLGDVSSNAMGTLNVTLQSVLPQGQLDVIFALDADSLISNEVMNWMKVATQFLTSGMSSRFSKYGVFTFSDQIKEVVDFSDYQSGNLVSYLKSISGFARHPSIQPKPSAVINKLHSLIDTSMSTAAKIGLILIDDDTDNDKDLQSFSTEAWEKGLNLISIGVGKHVDQQEVTSIARFQSDHYLQLRDWDTLNTDGFSWAIQTFQKLEPLHLYVKETVPPVTTPSTTPSVPDTTVVLEECSGVVDIAFAMDASGSLTTQMFNAIKLTVANTIANMKLSNNDVRVRGIVTFDDTVQEVAEDINDKVLLRELIFGAVHTKGMTKIDLAITRLTEYLLLEPKRNARRIGVVITDGKSMKPQNTREAAAAAVRNNVTMVAMGIGGPTDISYTELMDVANNVTDNFLWLKTLQSFLENGTKVLHERICSVTKGQDLITTTAPPVVTKDPNSPEELCARCSCIGRVTVSDPSDCSIYHVCQDSKYVATEYCDPDKFWDTVSQSCQLPMFANCAYDSCHLRPDGYNYTTLRLLEEKRCDQFYTCLNGRTKKLCTCGERLADDVMIHRKYDPLSDHCVDDLDGECFTIIDNRHQKITTPETWVCYLRATSSKYSFINLKTNAVQKCPGNLVYSSDKCSCVEESSPREDICLANVDLQFNKRSMQFWNVTLSDGQGVFDGKSVVSIKRLAGHYAHDFAVRVSLKTDSEQDMTLFENANCQETNLPSIKVYVKRALRSMAIIAQIKTAHGFVKFQLQSTALFRGYQTTLTLAAKAHKVAMWTSYRVAGTDPETRETDITLDLPAEQHLHCDSPLSLGSGGDPSLRPFKGTIDFFQWYYSCLPEDVADYFNRA